MIGVKTLTLNNKTVILENGKIKNHFEYFNIFFSASVIYALLSVVLIYNNVNGIGKTLFVFLTCAYSFYCLSKAGIKIKTGAITLMVFIGLLGISIFNTSDRLVIFINEVFMFISLIILLVHSYVNDDEWQLAEYIKSFMRTVFVPLALIGRITPKSEINYERSIGVHLNNDTEDVTQNNMTNTDNKCDTTKIVSKIGYVLIGLFMSFCLLIIILPLLFSADELFEELFTSMITSINVITYDVTDLFCMAILFIFILLASFLGIKYLNLGEANNTKVRERGKVNELIGITVFVVISLVYVMFSFVQIFGLFLNKMHLPAGETFSSYAREGFFQLLNVALMNLIMIVVSFYLFNKSKIIKILLTIISICTYIMLTSSIYRLVLYIGEYHLTKLRLYAFWGLIVVFFGLTGAVISIYNEKFKFARYGFITLLTLWTVFSFMRPEYVIAKYNVSKSASENIDLDYIASFSSDASGPIYEYLVNNKSKFGDMKKEDWEYYSSVKSTDFFFENDFCNYDKIKEYFAWQYKGANNNELKFNLSKWSFNNRRDLAKEILLKK